MVTAKVGQNRFCVETISYIHPFARNELIAKVTFWDPPFRADSVNQHAAGQWFLGCWFAG